MMTDEIQQDSFTEASSQGWLSRLGDAIKGVLVGIVLFILAFPLIFWNEGRAVKTEKALAEGRGAVVTVNSDRLDSANEGKLVHTTGHATAGETLSDAEFGVSTSAIRLKRKVEMQQWRETSRSEKRDKVGGGTETITTYSYSREWSDTLIDSSKFKQPDGHLNPRAMEAKGAQWTASKVTLGAFVLSPSQISSIDGEEPLPVAAGTAIPAGFAGKASVHGGSFYIGQDPQSPAIGDLRITFFRVPETDLTVVAKQSGNSFQPYRARAGGSVDLQRRGIAAADDMFSSAEQSNTVLTWILRGVGWLVMCVGIGLTLRPLSVLASVLPILGDVIGAGTWLVAFLLGSVLSAVIVALAWIAFRPLLGIALLVLGGACGYGMFHLVRKARAIRVAGASAHPA
jgi:hypothetical protein